MSFMCHSPTSETHSSRVALCLRGLGGPRLRTGNRDTVPAQEPNSDDGGSKAMTKADLVDIVANKTGLTKRDVAQVVEALLEAIKASLAQHKHIEIREFGTFKVKKRSMKYNPRDRSQKVVVPEKMVPVFKPSKFLKERVNWSGQEAAPGVTAGSESETGNSEEANV